MRARIKRVTLAEKIWAKKRELADIIVRESNCSLTRALNQVEFNMNYNRI